MSRQVRPFLEAARRIGRELVRSACWDADRRRCNWVGRSPQELTQVGAPIIPTIAALGPDLYGGSSGVALFLAQFAAIDGDKDAKAAATAAAANALRNAERIPAGSPMALSFHGGPLGVAFVAHRIDAMIGATDLADRADALLDRVVAEASAPHLFDVIGGHAGAIPALLALGRSLARPALIDRAIGLGDELLAAAERREEVWTWPADRVAGPDTSEVLLTGLAHGASGLGLALLELHAATGRPEFLRAGRGAFAYEDSVFDPAKGNWPDLRKPGPGAPPTAPAAPTFAMAWCHGAPGIALARARAAALDPERRDAHAAVARPALATTLAAWDRMRENPRVDATLCHGLSGLAEIVHTAGRWLDDRELTAAAAARARVLIDRHSATADWPSGIASAGPNPSLMLGTAGIGLHFLRLHDPDRVTGPLWIVPDGSDRDDPRGSSSSTRRPDPSPQFGV
jgi:lantibiotic modifying enzyme